ncbi:MAG: carbohydrate ABC transporter permease [Propionibacteriaceae bacterium]|jgi:raffinose/stachyose/melibiose transport system permease protein|nr:carbohydrate ABC transporter permease [Propionibacteriaceae bacterium]
MARPTTRRRPVDYPTVGLWIALVITCVVWATPFFMMFLTSVKSKPDITRLPTWALPTEWLWSNYAGAVTRGNLWVTGLNSVIVSVIKVPVGLLLAALAAFALARLRYRHTKLVLGLFALGSMVPIQVGLGPLFNIMLNLGLLDSVGGLILPYLAFGIPYQIFMLYGFFRAIPDELEESAALDGASTFRLFWQICVPLAKPALAALFVLDFVATWNEYAMATTLLQSQTHWTIPVAVQAFSGQHATEYGELNAFIIMTALPVLIVYLLFQRYFVSGAFSGALKG